MPSRSGSSTCSTRASPASASLNAAIARPFADGVPGEIGLALQQRVVDTDHPVGSQQTAAEDAST